MPGAGLAPIGWTGQSGDARPPFGVGGVGAPVAGGVYVLDVPSRHCRPELRIAGAAQASLRCAPTTARYSGACKGKRVLWQSRRPIWGTARESLSPCSGLGRHEASGPVVTHGVQGCAVTQEMHACTVHQAGTPMAWVARPATMQSPLAHAARRRRPARRGAEGWCGG